MVVLDQGKRKLICFSLAMGFKKRALQAARLGKSAQQNGKRPRSLRGNLKAKSNSAKTNHEA